MSEKVTEFDVLNRWLPRMEAAPGAPSMLVGPGDDCAVLSFGGGKLLAAVDSVIGDVHYYQNSTPAEKVAAKLLKRNLSDIAAMGGEPLWALLALNAAKVDNAWVDGFFSGLLSCAREYHVAVAGGDFASCPAAAPGVVASLTILGKAEYEPVLRSGAKPGDGIWVTGSFGNSLAGRHLDFVPRIAEGRFLARNAFADAMLDISDSLAVDLGRVAVASGVTVELDPERIPCNTTLQAALADGEDYELAFAVPPEREAELREQWNFATRLTRIGVCREFAQAPLIDRDGRRIEAKGYEHTV